MPGRRLTRTPRSCGPARMRRMCHRLLHSPLSPVTEPRREAREGIEGAGRPTGLASADVEWESRCWKVRVLRIAVPVQICARPRRRHRSVRPLTSSARCRPGLDPGSETAQRPEQQQPPLEAVQTCFGRRLPGATFSLLQYDRAPVPRNADVR